MHTVPRALSCSRFAIAIATLLFFACSAASAAPIKAELTGAQEVPPVDTKASGTAQFQLRSGQVH